MYSATTPLPTVTLDGLCIDRLKGEAQSPAAQSLGNEEPSKSSRHCIWNAPFAYDEYCVQLMNSCTGSVEGSSVPPKVEFPAHTLKCIDMPWEAFCVYSFTLAPVTFRITKPTNSHKKKTGDHTNAYV